MVFEIPDLTDSDSDEEQQQQRDNESTAIPSMSQIQKSLEKARERQKKEEQNSAQIRAQMRQSMHKPPPQQRQRRLYSSNQQAPVKSFSGTTTPNKAASSEPVIPSYAIGQNAGISSSSNKFQPVPTRKNIIFARTQQSANPIFKNSKVRAKLQFRKDLIPDFIISKDVCILYLSLRFHIQHPNYITGRLKELENLFNLRVLLVNMDLHRKGNNKSIRPGSAKTPHISDLNRATDHSMDETQKRVLSQLTKVCLDFNATMMLAFSQRQAAQYIDMYSQFAHMSSQVLKTKVENDYLPIMRNALTSIKSVNKTDSDTLMQNFGSFTSIVSTSKSDLLTCPGLGKKKVDELFDAFHTPFVPQGNRKKVSSKQVRISKFMK